MEMPRNMEEWKKIDLKSLTPEDIDSLRHDTAKQAQRYANALTNHGVQLSVESILSARFQAIADLMVNWFKVPPELMELIVWRREWDLFENSLEIVKQQKTGTQLITPHMDLETMKRMGMLHRDNGQN